MDRSRCQLQLTNFVFLGYLRPFLRTQTPAARWEADWSGVLLCSFLGGVVGTVEFRLMLGSAAQNGTLGTVVFDRRRRRPDARVNRLIWQEPEEGGGGCSNSGRLTWLGWGAVLVRSVPGITTTSHPYHVSSG